VADGDSFGVATSFGACFSARAGLAVSTGGAVCSKILSMSSAFLARETDFTPNAWAIAMSCSRSFDSSTDCSSASAAIAATFHMPTHVRSGNHSEISESSRDFVQIYRKSSNERERDAASEINLGNPRYDHHSHLAYMLQRLTRIKHRQ
jgi:hypothetical protein